MKFLYTITAYDKFGLSEKKVTLDVVAKSESEALVFAKKAITKDFYDILNISQVIK